MKDNEIKEISVYTLTNNQINFLESVGTIVDSRSLDIADGIPVYIKDGNRMSFIYDYVLIDNKSFEKGRKELCECESLYRGGGVIIPTIGDNCIAIYDDRHNWFRPIAGISKFDEGLNLEITAVREGIIEELLVCDSNEHDRIIPPVIDDISTLSLAAHNWNMKLQEISVVGNVTINYTLNNENGAFECVVIWELSGSPASFKFFHQEDWFKGGPSGIVPVTLDKSGNVTGYWSGRQGYVALPIQKIHPTLKQFWLDEN